MQETSVQQHYDVQLLINTLILVLFLIGTQNFFFVTRSDKTKKMFLYFNIGVVTPQMFFGNKGKKNKNNVYVWKLYSIKIHLLHPFVYQYLSLPITIECY